MPKDFIKERFWFSPFVFQRVSLEKHRCYVAYIRIYNRRAKIVYDLFCAHSHRFIGYTGIWTITRMVDKVRIHVYIPYVWRGIFTGVGRSRLTFLEDLFLHQPQSSVVVPCDLIDRRHSEICSLNLTHYRV